jgi:hypothetical protein
MTLLIGNGLPVASSKSFLTVRTVSRGPPSSKAALILSLPCPGICALRSRGIEVTAIAL